MSIRSTRRASCKQQLIDCGATAIVIMENFAHKLEQVLGETQIRHVLVARLGDFMPPLKRAVFNFANTYVRKSVPAWRFENFTLLQQSLQPRARTRIMWMPRRGRHRPRSCNIPAAPLA